MEIIIHRKEALNNVVEALLLYANGATKFLLNAEMGAGKTTFCKAFAAYIGVKESTSSPTFSLVNEYRYEKEGTVKVMRHLDLYRLRTLQEVLDIGIEDFLDDDNYTFIEWADLIEPLLPPNVIRINIEILGKKKRKFIFVK